MNCVWIRIPLGKEVELGAGDIVSYGDPATPHGKGHSSPHFSAHGYCGQTAGWIRLLLVQRLDFPQTTLCHMETQLLPTERRTEPPRFRNLRTPA